MCSSAQLRAESAQILATSDLAQRSSLRLVGKTLVSGTTSEGAEERPLMVPLGGGVRAFRVMAGAFGAKG